MVAPAANHTTSNGSGSVGLAELNLVLAAFGKSIGDTDYKVEADFNSDGAINLQDLNIQIAQSGKSIARGHLSASGNIIGYAGYIFEPATEMHVVRHRWYSPLEGRWCSAEPLHYVDGQSRYAYAVNSPINHTDPSGNIPAAMRGCGIEIKIEQGPTMTVPYPHCQGNNGKTYIDCELDKYQSRQRCKKVCKAGETDLLGPD